MQSCTAADSKQDANYFTYFVQIACDGKSGDGFIYPVNNLSQCFYTATATAAAEYPAHKFKRFILQFDMKLPNNFIINGLRVWVRPPKYRA